MDSILDPCSLVDILRWRAQAHPDKLAYSFLTDGESEAQRLTFRELDEKARAIGAHLQKLGIMGKCVLLLYPQGLDYVAAFWGCLYAKVIAVPLFPPRNNRVYARVQAVLQDSGAVLALTDQATMNKVQKRFASMPELQQLDWYVTSDLDMQLAGQWQKPNLNSDDLAYLQYTSGSTASPRGVMVSHKNLLYNLDDLDAGWVHTPESVLVSWLPIFHDMGLIYGVLQAVFIGFHSVLMAPATFGQQPYNWLQAISYYKATHSAGPNFAYELCVEKISPEQRQTLDLSHWQVALNGAEPVRAQTLKRFADAFASCGIHYNLNTPGYGLAEATLKVTACRNGQEPVLCSVQLTALEQNKIVVVPPEHENAYTLVGCGSPMKETKVVIVNPDTLTRCDPDEVGEIWVSGPTVTQGYWNNPEATQHTFCAYLTDNSEGPFLRTGDLGFLQDDELFVTGRLKDVLIIRGANYYPQDIELAVEQCHSALRPGCGVAFSFTENGEEHLVVAQEVRRAFSRRLDVDEIVLSVRQTIAAYHALKVHTVLLLKTTTIPKTSSGKIQRQQCRQRFLQGELNVLAEWSIAPNGHDKAETTVL